MVCRLRPGQFAGDAANVGEDDPAQQGPEWAEGVTRGSPNGKWVFTANTLTGTVTIIDTAADTLVKSLPRDAGCGTGGGQVRVGARRSTSVRLSRRGARVGPALAGWSPGRA